MKNFFKIFLAIAVLFTQSFVYVDNVASASTKANSTIYVSNSGNDSNNGTNQNTPIKTLEKAFLLVDTSGPSGGEIVISGFLTVQSIYKTPENKGKVTLRALNSTSTITFRHNFVLGDDITFKDITIATGTTDPENNNRMVANGHTLTMDIGTKMDPADGSVGGKAGALPRLYAGGYGTPSPGGTIIVNAGDYSEIHSGGVNTKNIKYGSSAPHWAPSVGVDSPAPMTSSSTITINNSNVTQGLYLSGSGNGSTITGDANIILNNTKISGGLDKGKVEATNSVTGKKNLTFNNTNMEFNNTLSHINDVDNLIIKGGSNIELNAPTPFSNVGNLTLEAGNSIDFSNEHRLRDFGISGNFVGGGNINMSKDNKNFSIAGQVSGQTNFIKNRRDVAKNHIYFTAGSKATNSGFNYTASPMYVLENTQSAGREQWKLISNPNIKYTVYVDGSYTGTDSDGSQAKPVKTLDEANTLVSSTYNGKANKIIVSGPTTSDTPITISKWLEISSINNAVLTLNAPITFEWSCNITDIIIDTTKSPTKDLFFINLDSETAIVSFQTGTKLLGKPNIYSGTPSANALTKDFNLIINSGDFGTINAGDKNGIYNGNPYLIQVNGTTFDAIDGAKTKTSSSKISPSVILNSIGTISSPFEIDTITNVSHLRFGASHIKFNNSLNALNILRIDDIQKSTLHIGGNVILNYLLISKDGAYSTLNTTMQNGKSLTINTISNDTNKTVSPNIDLTINPPTTGDIAQGVYLILPISYAKTVTLNPPITGYSLVESTVGSQKHYSLTKDGVILPTAKTVEVSGANTLTVSDTSVASNYSATVKDDTGSVISAPVAFKLDKNYTGVSITNNGLLTVDPTSTTQSINIIATTSNGTIESAPFKVDITKIIQKVPTSITVKKGSTNITSDNVVVDSTSTANGTKDIVVNYTATVNDQDGNIMPSENTQFIITSIIDTTTNKPISTAYITPSGELTINKYIPNSKINIKVTSISTPSLSTNYTVNVTVPKPVPTKVLINGKSQIDINTTNVNEKYDTIVKDKDDKIITNEKVKFTMQTPYNGATITDDGNLTLTKDVASGTITIKAQVVSTPSVTTTHNIVINKIPAVLPIGSVEIAGPDKLELITNHTNATYISKVKDTSGADMPAETVIFSLIGPPPTGVTITPTGNLTIENTITVPSITIKATSTTDSTIFAELTITITKITNTNPATAIRINGLTNIDIIDDDVKTHYTPVFTDINGDPTVGTATFTLLPNPLPQGVGGSFGNTVMLHIVNTVKDGTVIDISATDDSNPAITNTIKVTINNLPSIIPNSLDITGLNQIILTNKDQSIQYDTIIKNDTGDILPSTTAKFTLTNPIKGVDITENGLLTIKHTVPNKTLINIKAESGSVTNTKEITVIKQDVPATEISIFGNNSITLVDKDITESYTATVLDKDNNVINEPTKFTIVSAPTGVTITKNGTLNIPKNTQNDKIKIKAELISNPKLFGEYIINVAPATIEISGDKTIDAKKSTITSKYTAIIKDINDKEIMAPILFTINENVKYVTIANDGVLSVGSDTPNQTIDIKATINGNNNIYTTYPVKINEYLNNNDDSSNNGNTGNDNNNDNIINNGNGAIIGGGNTNNNNSNNNSNDNKDIVINLPSTILDGQTITTIDDKKVNEIIEKSKASTSNTISLNLEEDATKFEISEGNIKKILTQSNLEISTNIGEVTFKQDMANELHSSKNKFVVSLTESNNIVNIKVTIGNTDISTKNTYLLSLNNKALTNNTVPVILGPNGIETIVKKSINNSGDIDMVLNSSSQIKFKENKKDMTDTSNHWANNQIDYVLSRELFAGTDTNTFSPNQTMTRGMLISVLHRLEGGKILFTTNFDDVDPNAYYSNAVTWGAENKIITGTGNNNFNPESEVTREQLAVIVNNYLSTIDISNNSTTNTYFSDINTVSPWAKDAINNMNALGIMSGKTSSTINPKDTATRAEVATILLNIIRNIVK